MFKSDARFCIRENTCASRDLRRSCRVHHSAGLFDFSHSPTSLVTTCRDEVNPPVRQEFSGAIRVDGVV